jgi:hypothetical protein
MVYALLEQGDDVFVVDGIFPKDHNREPDVWRQSGW